MNKLGKTISYWRDYLILIIALALSMSMLFFANSPRQLGGIHTLSLEILGRLSAPMAALRGHMDVAVENRLLRQQNTVLQLKNAQLAEAYYENMRLRQLLGFKMMASYPLVAAQVIARTNETAMESIIIDAGAAQGIKTNMTVVSGDGLVGRIISVSSTYAVVQTMQDRNFRCGALLQRSRLQGVFQWAGYDTGLLTGIYLSSDVKPGDVVVTSGVNSFFVPGLKIGTVTQIDEAGSGLFQRIYIKPKVDLTVLEEVFVVRSEFANPGVVR